MVRGYTKERGRFWGGGEGGGGWFAQCRVNLDVKANLIN